ncbi:sigma-54 interaction domain-containing protein [Balneola sp. MJW-20]|uniref:sigma-54 interaction domain-containing protein n=1 Tax=Gracilimonas aurantiaca TaxID=3234185 RepID=UPI0034677806
MYDKESGGQKSAVGDVCGAQASSRWITQNAEVQEIKRKAVLIAKSKVPILLTGENGTGKEVLARFIHDNSIAEGESKKSKPFIAVNCGAIPTDLLESELFGYEKGAFTGATTTKEGAFELANGGTLFLDEVGELPAMAQVKLLRAVEYQSFRRLGGKKEINVNIRVISATNKVLHDSIKAGDFREDLYYRLNVVELFLPPLRHRKDDIPLLTEYYLNIFSKKYGVPMVHADECCVEIMKKYSWPGNIRELKNAIERCIILSKDGNITKEMLPERITESVTDQDCGKMKSEQDELSDTYIKVEIGTPLEEIEERVIKQTLNSVNNNKSEAANILGFSRKTLHNKLQKYDT